MSLQAVAAILKVADDGNPPCQQVGDVVRGQLARVEEQLARLTALQAQLIELQQRLEELPGETSNAYHICPCLEAVFDQTSPGDRRSAPER